MLITDLSQAMYVGDKSRCWGNTLHLCCLVGKEVKASCGQGTWAEEAHSTTTQACQEAPAEGTVGSLLAVVLGVGSRVAGVSSPTGSCARGVFTPPSKDPIWERQHLASCLMEAILCLPGEQLQPTVGGL